MREREERPRRLLDRDRATPFLDELDEPVCRVEPKLHVKILSEHMFACKSKKKAALVAAFFDVLTSLEVASRP
jgi:hypothetical protein